MPQSGQQGAGEDKENSEGAQDESESQLCARYRYLGSCSHGERCKFRPALALRRPPPRATYSGDCGRAAALRGAA